MNRDISVFILKYNDDIVKYGDINIKISAYITKSHGWFEHSSKPDYDIWIVTEGEIEIETENEKVILSRGDVYMFFPNNIYKASCVTNQCGFFFTHFDFKIGLNNRALESYDLNALYKYESISAAVEPFLNIKNFLDNENSLPYLQVKGFVLILLSQMIRIRGLNKSHTVNSSESITRFNPVLEYISLNMDKRIKTTELADIMFLSEKYFINLFKRALGISPAKFVMQSKITKALEYLYMGCYSIKDISVLLGFPDLYSFSKAFKKNIGVSPTSVLDSL